MPSGTQHHQSGNNFPAPALGATPGGQLWPMPAMKFRPQQNEGQVIAIGAASVQSAALELGSEHWIWATKHCWIIASGVFGEAAAAGDFPLPAGAVVTFSYRTDLAGDVLYSGRYISVIETAESAGLPGNLYIGQSFEE